MSIEVIKAIFETSKASGTDRLMLLAIAEHLDAKGVCWPSIERLARWCNTSSRHAIRLVENLRQLGELEVQRSAGPRGVNLYRVKLQALTHVSPHDTCVTPDLHVTHDTCVTHDTQGTTPDMQGHLPLTPMSPKPPLNPQEPPESARTKKPARKKSGKQTFKDWYEATKVEGQSLLPADHWIKKYCEESQLGNEFLQLHWAWWMAKQLEDGKLQADWIKTFSNSVKGNYGHLWYRKDGTWMLTAAGKQAALVHRFDEDMTSSAPALQGNRV